GFFPLGAIILFEDNEYNATVASFPLELNCLSEDVKEKMNMMMLVGILPNLTSGDLPQADDFLKLDKLSFLEAVHVPQQITIQSRSASS
ncbi:hypothetical protein NL676_016170, partial [Syzygium grande]